eukprot:SAG25_NODE_4125_length_883_cov_126.173469_1_plen_293_part_11
MKRVVLLQDSLEGDEVAPWVRAEWTTEQCEAVGEPMVGVMSLEGGSKEAQTANAVRSAVMSLLSALDSLSENFVDRAEVLLTALQEGGEEAVVALARVLEHALSVLEALRMSTPRRERKVITVMSDRVEKLLDTMDENDLISQIAACEESCLVVLVERLCAVEALSEAEAGDTADAIACVEAMVDEVERCGDPVATASRMLGSNAARQRAQGLAVLSALPRVVLEEACDAEVACVSLVMDLSQDSRHDIAERTLAASAQFTLCFRNTAIPPDVDGFVAHVRSAHKEWINASPG